MNVYLDTDFTDSHGFYLNFSDAPKILSGKHLPTSKQSAENNKPSVSSVFVRVLRKVSGSKARYRKRGYVKPLTILKRHNSKYLHYTINEG